MLPSFLITFRETLEASLIVGIILGYLQKTERSKLNNVIYTAMGAAVLTSIAIAFVFNRLMGGFTGRAEAIFEGILMIFAAILLTSMILWMLKQKDVKKDLHSRIEHGLENKERFNLFFLVFISVLREGIETVIFLNAASKLSSGNSILGGFLGVFFAIVLGYVLFVWSKKVNIKFFFNATSILLILFAAGLTAHGLHEFQEAGVVPIFIEHLYDVNPIIDENGFTGSLLKGLFGYNRNPSLIESISYIMYLGMVGGIWLQNNIKKK